MVLFYFFNLKSMSCHFEWLVFKANFFFFKKKPKFHERPCIEVGSSVKLYQESNVQNQM